jgi:DNA-binding CsgD family transcriptional regulator
MPGFLLVMTLVTDVILVIVAAQAFRMSRRIETRFARLQATIVILLCVAGVVASLQDIGVLATRLGWVSEEVGSWFVGRVHALIVITGLFVIVPVLVILRKLTVEFAQAESVTDALVNRLPDGVTMESAGLTPREIEVVSAIAAGNVSDQQLADHLFISASTAATHVRNIMKKTDIKRRTDLTLLAVVDWDDRL